MRPVSKAVGRDGLAFVAVMGFALALYSSVVNLFPILEPLRPALATAGIGAFALALGRIASGLPITWDGGRGMALIGFVAWAGASFLWSFEPSETRRSALELIKLAGIYLTVVNVTTTPKRLALLCGAMVVASLAPSIGAIDRWTSGTDLVDGYRARWLGVYADPNHLAMSLVAVIPLAAVMVLRSRSMLMRLVSAAAAGLAVAAIVLTHSRSGALGLLLAVVLFALSSVNKLRSIGVAALLSLGVALYAPKSFWQRTETITTYERDVAAQGRIWAWQVGEAINRDRPLLGVGSGAFRAAWADYAPPEARGSAFVAHNIFLAALGELGFVGFLLFAAFVAMALSGAVRAWREPELGPLARALVSGLSGYILCGMMSGYVLSAHFFFLTALAASAQRVYELSGGFTAPAPKPVPRRRAAEAFTGGVA